MIPYVGTFDSVEIRVSDFAFPKEWTQVRFPKSKRKRIRKKWRKDRRNWGAVEPLGVAWRMPDGSIVTNRRTFEAMRRGWRGSLSVGGRVEVEPLGFEAMGERLRWLAASMSLPLSMLEVVPFAVNRTNAEAARRAFFGVAMGRSPTKGVTS